MQKPHKSNELQRGNPGGAGGVCVRVSGSPEVFNMLSVVFYRNSKYDLAAFQEG